MTTTQAPPYPDRLRADVEGYLADLRFAPETATHGLEEAMRYSLLAGGKRIRPVLALATAHAVGMPTEAVLPLKGDRLAIVNDNNLGSTRGRNPDRPDPSDFIVVAIPGLRR